MFNAYKRLNQSLPPKFDAILPNPAQSGAIPRNVGYSVTSKAIWYKHAESAAVNSSKI